MESKSRIKLAVIFGCFTVIYTEYCDPIHIAGKTNVNGLIDGVIYSRNYPFSSRYYYHCETTLFLHRYTSDSAINKTICFEFESFVLTKDVGKNTPAQSLEFKLMKSNRTYEYVKFGEIKTGENLGWLSNVWSKHFCCE